MAKKASPTKKSVKPKRSFRDLDPLEQGAGCCLIDFPPGKE